MAVAVVMYQRFRAQDNLNQKQDLQHLPVTIEA